MKLLDFALHEFVILTTYKRDKTPVPTVVWIAQNGDHLVVTTNNNAGKVKRIRNDSDVTLCGTNRNGTEKLTKNYEAKGYEVIDEDGKLSGLNAMRSKYGALGKTMTKGPIENRSIIKITELIK